MSEDKKELATIEQQIDKSAKALASETIKILSNIGPKNNPSFTLTLTILFIKHIVEQTFQTFLFGQRSEYEKTKDPAIEPATAELLKNSRRALGLAIGDAFSNALTAFSGRHVDYVCAIQAVPDKRDEKHTFH